MVSIVMGAYSEKIFSCGWRDAGDAPSDGARWRNVIRVRAAWLRSWRGWTPLIGADFRVSARLATEYKGRELCVGAMFFGKSRASQRNHARESLFRKSFKC